MAAKLKKGDKVIVVAGKDRGAQSTILSVNPKKGRAVVQDVNRATAHVKGSGAQQSRRESREMSIDLSNLMLIDPEGGRPTRVGFRIEEGKKVRFAKQSGVKIDG